MELMDRDELYDSQVTAVVHGFLMVWNRFDATLSKELNQIQDRMQGMHPDGENQQKPNYELFYRACINLHPEGSLSMGEFSNVLSVPLSTATRIADWLVDHEYIERLPDSGDRRVVRIALTDMGKELFKTIDQYVRQRIQQVLAGLTIEERTILLTLLRKLIVGLKEVAR
jgi:DNA-binding MarR family transcriptional regulator